jgi:hypothetical protein
MEDKHQRNYGLIIHKALLSLVALGWLLSIGAVFIPALKIAWFSWCVPLTLYLFIHYLRPFGMPEMDLPTEEELKAMEAQYKEKEANGNLS